MSEEKRDQMWSAYLDGELNAADAAEFDQSLSAKERDALAAEMRLELGIAEALSSETRCPDEVWNRTRAAILDRAGVQTRRTIPRWAYGVLAVAATVLVAVGGAVYRTARTDAQIFTMPETTTTVLAQHAEFRSSDFAEVGKYLRQYGFSIGLNKPNEDDHHSREILGASHEMYKGVEVAAVLFDCCGKPIKVVLAPEGSDAAVRIADAADRGEMQDMRHVGSSVMAAIGRHDVSEVLDLFSEDTDSGSIAQATNLTV